VRGEMATSIGQAVEELPRKELTRALVVAPAVQLATILDTRLAGVEPWKVVVGTAGASLALAYLYSLTQGRQPLTARLRARFFQLMRKIPAVRKQIEGEKEKIRLSFEKEYSDATEGVPNIRSLPAGGLGKDAVLSEAKLHLGLGDLDWMGGAMSGTVYNSSHELGTLMTEVYGLAAWTNPLHSDAFPGLRKMEAEVVRIACDLFNGSSDSCGCVTTGGTESIILACKAYRDKGREAGIEVGEMLVPVTAHAAFDKAAELLGMRIRHVPVDEVTKRVKVETMSRMISSRTVMLVGSAPQFPHGSMDSIQDISALGVRKGIPVHVDACLGGFLVAFMEEAGFSVPPFDFRLPGVTSISADTHKYGFAPKGSSVILYRDMKYREHQWFCFPDWPGGIYATPTIGGSRAGGIVAACWAALLYFGREGYVSATREIVTTTRRIADAIRATPGVAIVGCPDVSVVAFDSPEFNIYAINDGMKDRGWALNALQFPSCLHLAVTKCHTLPGVADRFIKDLQEVTAAIRLDPSAAEKSDSAVFYGGAAAVPDRSIVSALTGVYLDSLYYLGPAGPASKEKAPGS